MMNSAGSCSEMIAFSPGGSSSDSSVISSKTSSKFSGSVEAGAEIDLAEIFDRRQLVRIVRGDAAHARVDGEGDLDHLVERRLVVGGAERAAVFVAAGPSSAWRWNRARRRSRGRARSRTGRRGRSSPHAGRRRSTRSSSRPCFAAKASALMRPSLRSGAVGDEPLDRVRRRRIGRLPQQREHGLGFAHGEIYSCNATRQERF